ncbi:MAG: pyridoxamine 5'-phosphate oxidase family protein [Acidimicrobiia bacterium]
MAKKDITMTDKERIAFLSAPHTLIVSSIDRRGYPHLSPMWYALDQGRIVFRSFTKSQKIVNLRRNPQIGVLVEEGESYEELRGVMIQGDARLVDDPEYVLDLYGLLAARYAFAGGEPVPFPDRASLEAAFGRFAPKNTAVVVEPRRISSWDHRKLSGGY